MTGLFSFRKSVPKTLCSVHVAFRLPFGYGLFVCAFVDGYNHGSVLASTPPSPDDD